MLLRVIILASLVTLIGCIYVPSFDDQPPPYEFSEQIKIGQSSKEDVISLLGAPNVLRGRSSIAVYDNSRVSGYIAAFIPPRTGVGYSFKDFASTLIEFEDNLVTFVGWLSDGYGCYGNGICLDSGWTTHSELRLIDELTALSSTNLDDNMAKAFRVPEDGCNIYIYAEGDILTEYPVLVSMGDKHLVPISIGNYLNLELPYDSQNLKVFHSGTDFIDSGEAELLAEADVTCHQASVDFVQITYKFGESGSNTRSAKAALVDIAKGRSEILQRRLLLLP